MSVIELEVDQFNASYAHLHWFGTFPLTVEELTLSLVTVGRANWVDAFHGGRLRWLEIEGLAAQTQAYIEAGPKGLRTTTLYRSLDQSEKTAFAYRLGMAFAKAVASFHFDIPWLYHLDRVRGSVTLLSGNARPDLIGPDVALHFHVVEAKAKANPSDGFVLDTKNKAARVVAVAGVPPATTVASIVDLKKDPISVIYSDPPLREDDPTSFTFDVDAFLSEYYSPFLMAEEAGVELLPERHPELPGSPTYLTSKLPGTPYRIGIRKDVLDVLRGPGGGRADALSNVLSQDRRSSAGQERPRRHGVAVQPDGIILINDAPTPDVTEQKKGRHLVKKGTSRVRTAAPTDLPEADLARAAALIEEAGEVEPNFALPGLRRASRVALAYEGSNVVGVAALKSKTPEQIGQIAQRARAVVPRDAVELGYFAIDPELRGRGIGKQLASSLREELTGNVIATTRSDNVPMHRILRQLGFEEQPGRWPSATRPGVTLVLWIRAKP